MMIRLMSLMVLAVLSFANKTDWTPPGMEVPDDNPMTKERIELGKLLFFDRRLSRARDISCATCHVPSLAWTDGRPKAVGNGGQKGKRNTPTIVNSAYQESYFWDGRAGSLEEQALGPMAAHNEMALGAEEAVERLEEIAGYVALFTEAYPEEGLCEATLAKALATFERTIVTHNTPFDAWMRGEKGAELSKEAQEGFALFEEKGKCSKCHGGFNFTYGSFDNVGLGDKEDLGIYALNGNRIWYGAFKTPTLRDVAKTAPYFHDGSVHTLEEAVHICGNGGRYKDAPRSPFFRDRGLSMEEVRLVVAFLQTLSSPKGYVDVPTEFPK